MTYFLIAGEASGDLHASNLMKSIKAEDPYAEFYAMGGDLMKAEGAVLFKHYRDMAYMGITAVVMNARTILRNLECCYAAIEKVSPDLIILVDYPGFNLKVAKYVKTHFVRPVYYYISPKIWAWKQYRIRDIRRYVNRMFCIFPFEKEFYERLGYPIYYVGNPTVDAIAAYHTATSGRPDTFRADNGLDNRPILALLAGSRKREVQKNLPTMLAVAARHPEFQPVVAGAPGLTPDDYAGYMAAHGSVALLFDQTYPLLAHSHTALVTSGTATLETALFRVPQAVCYHVGGGWLANLIFRRFFHVPYISLVNLIAGRNVVRELFGGLFTRRTVAAELDRLLHDNDYRNTMIAGYDDVARTLGSPGASEQAGRLIIDLLCNEPL